MSPDEALARAGVTDATLTAAERAALDLDGYVVLRGVFDPARCAALRATFERKYLPGDRWPAPRENGTRFAVLNSEPDVLSACLSPRVLACVHHMLRRRFFLFEVQGRDPLRDGGNQKLHRDWVSPAGPAPMVIAMAFLDPFGAANGATRVIPGSHRLDGGPDAYASYAEHPEQVVIGGAAGDILVFDGYLAHSGTRNVDGAPRRSLQICFYACEAQGGDVPARDLAAAPPDLRYFLDADA